MSFATITNYIDVTQKKPIVVKLHRSLFFDPRNTPEDVQHLSERWKPSLENIFGNYTPLVIGYNGGDNTLMEYLCDPSNTLRHGLYWFKRTNDPLPDRVKDMLSLRNGTLIEIDEPSAFDWMMWKIGQHKRHQDATEWLHNRAHELSKRYNDQVASFAENAKDKAVMKDINQRWLDQITEANRRIKKNPEDSRAWFDRADACDKIKDYKSAVADFTKAIELNPQYTAAYINRGYAYNALKQYEKAITDCCNAIELDPKMATAYNNRGYAYNDLEQYEKAIADYCKAIEQDPQRASAYNNRGSAYNNLKQYEKAIADSSKAIELDPQMASAYNIRGYAYNKLKQYEEAVADFSKAIELNPQMAHSYNYRGYVYNELGQYEKAYMDYSKVIELDPQYPQAYNNRARVYDALNKPELVAATVQNTRYAQGEDTDFPPPH
ncbi:MAG: tetratricopeptide repeat protein [Lachnospiraceae bacterium]|jgi:tetratricopeptide (TPR) repeat protein|nr:tetratricopeptide repeat protein [Lachnospiraceae bacterium]